MQPQNRVVIVSLGIVFGGRFIETFVEGLHLLETKRRDGKEVSLV